MATTLLVPDAAAPIDVCADLRKRSISVTMKLKAPAERKTTKARLNWLLRQIQKADVPGLHVRIFWPGRAAFTQHPLSALRDNPDIASTDRAGLVAVSFEVMLVRDVGSRFGQRKNFISELEDAVPAFYNAVGQHLKSWQAPAPRLPNERADVDTVTTEALREEAESVALAREE